MQAVFDHLEFRLGPRDAFAIDRAAAAAITVLAGSVWITQDGRRADHVLKAGQSLQVRGDAPLLVSALGQAEVSVDAPVRGLPHRPPWMRLARGLKAAYLRGFRGMAARSARRRIAAGAWLI